MSACVGGGGFTDGGEAERAEKGEDGKTDTEQPKEGFRPHGVGAVEKEESDQRLEQTHAALSKGPRF